MLRNRLRGGALFSGRGLSAALGRLVSDVAGCFTVAATVSANCGAQISGNRVSWRISIGEYARRPRLALSVRYALG